MSKALEILKDIKDSIWCGVKPTLAKFTVKDINEAIAELEAQEAKQCCNCKYYDGYACTNKNSIAYRWENRIYPQDGCKEDFTTKATK